MPNSARNLNSNNNSEDKEYDEVKIYLPKGWKEKIVKHAKLRGYRTYNEYIRNLIRRDLGEQFD